MNFFIHTQRFCPRTLIMAQRYRNYLIANGWTPSLQHEADLIFIFGCDFSNEEKNYALSQIAKYKKIRRERPGWSSRDACLQCEKTWRFPSPALMSSDWRKPPGWTG